MSDTPICPKCGEQAEFTRKNGLPICGGCLENLTRDIWENASDLGWRMTKAEARAISQRTYLSS
jgi:predicted amidophosphoribosyltransferase